MRLENTVGSFWLRVDQSGECWEWTGYRTRRGYGQVSWRNRIWRVHRLAFEFARGPIPPGLTIDHLCRNRACCNPGHMEPATNRENVLRGNGAAAVNSRKTHCYRGHPFDDTNTRHLRNGDRACRICRRRVRAEFACRRRENAA
jgi:hypothetical protein